MKAWKRGGIDSVVSLLTSDEVAELDLSGEASLCRANGIEFVSSPIPDRGLPASVGESIDLVARLAEQLAVGRNVGVHCRQDIGRSALVKASTLVAVGLAPESP